MGAVFDDYWDANDANEAACSVVISTFRCPSDPSPEQFGQSSFINDRAINSYNAVSSGTVGDVRLLRWRPCPTNSDPNIDRDFVVAARNGVLVPNQIGDPSGFCSGGSVGERPQLRTRIRISDITDGQSNTLMVGETIFDNGSMAGTSTNYFSDHWVMGSPQIDSQGFDLSEHMGSTFNEFNMYHQLSNEEILAMSTSQRVQASIQIAGGFGGWHAGDVVNFLFADGSVRLIEAGVDSTVRFQLGSRNDGVQNIGF